MSLTSMPYGKCEFSPANIGLADLRGVDGRSTLWQVMEAFCHKTEGQAARVAFGTTGAIVMIITPGDPNSGHIYLYDGVTQMFAEITFAEKDSFNPSHFDIVMTTYDLHLFLDMSSPEEKKPVSCQWRGQRHHGGARRQLACNSAAA
jgi:hypothetical protein